MITQPTPPARPPLLLTHQAAYRWYRTNDCCHLAALLERWGWERHRLQRHTIRLTRGTSLIAVDMAGSCIAHGPGAVAALALASQGVHE